jgi:predicted MFS family arabinose efflux permease
MGTRELGLTGITQALGLGAPIGISLGLVRRGRVLLWAAVGLLCLAWFRRTATEEKAPDPIDQAAAAQEAREHDHKDAPGESSVVRESSAS